MATHANARRGPGAAVIFGKNIAAQNKPLTPKIKLSGRAIAWLTVPMVVTTFVIVVLRYAFDLGWIWMQESVIWMHAVVFMLAGAYTLNWDAHVRVDIFYRGMSSRRKAWVNLLGIALFLMPVSVFLIATSWEYVVCRGKFMRVPEKPEVCPTRLSLS